MRLAVFLVLCVTAACTRTNPNLCCVGAPDCAAADLPDPTPCKSGLVCRGNQCIAQSCEASADCDAATPYCVVDTGPGLCAEACTEGMQCPGFGQAVEQSICSNGACVQCTANTDCTVESPICDVGSCRACTSHAECASGFCETDGTCVDESLVSYVTSAGSSASDCTKLAPCGIARALQLTRKYIAVSAGTHTADAGLLLAGNRWILGTASGRPRLTTTASGPVLTVQASANITLEHVEVFGGSGGASPGIGILCSSSAILRISDCVVSQNAGDGVTATTCSVTATRSRFTENERGISIFSATGVIDRCVFDKNRGVGIKLSNGTYSVTNSFVHHNVGGIDATAITAQFDTIVDNAGTSLSGLTCADGSNVSNLIVARNQPMNVAAGCTPTSSVISSDVSALQFKSPNVEPYDYHLKTGSSAIDQGTAALNHDFDGEMRPKGVGPDIGADEAE